MGCTQSSPADADVAFSNIGKAAAATTSKEGGSTPQKQQEAASSSAPLNQAAPALAPPAAPVSPSPSPTTTTLCSSQQQPAPATAAAEPAPNGAPHEKASSAPAVRRDSTGPTLAKVLDASRGVLGLDYAVHLLGDSMAQTDDMLAGEASRGLPNQAKGDEEWDWDYTNFGAGPGPLEPGEGGPTPDRAASMVEKAAHNASSLGEPAPFRETTALRVDKVQGCMFVNQYLVTKFLGRGACGKVFLCLNTHDFRLYAMKAVRKVDLGIPAAPAPGVKRPHNPMEDLLREISIMKKMKHPNIVTLHEIIDDPVGNKLLLVMELMDGGPLLTREALDKGERVPESIARRSARDMIKALDYLHAHMVVHGDLKPENVLVSTSGVVKLSDFGCSKVFASNEYLDRCNGTPAFLAPEMMKPNSRYRGRPTDVYALGACLYTLVFGRIPFSAPNVYKLFQVVQKEPVTFPPDIPISDALQNLLEALLIKAPQQRITLAEVSKHPWITLDGRFPLKCVRELNEGESNEQHDLLPEPGLTFARANPEPDMMAGMSRLGSHEHTYKQGDVILKQGDKGMYLLYILTGKVDILIKKVAPSKSNTASPRSDTSASNDKAAKGGGMNDSGSGSGPPPQADIEYRQKLLRASRKAADFVKKLQMAAAGDTPGAGMDLVVAQRGPGSLIGDMAMFSKTGQRYASVRCATAVTARVILKDQLEMYLQQHPIAKVQIKERITKQQAELNVVDALVKLANAHDDIAAPLMSIGVMAGHNSGSGSLAGNGGGGGASSGTHSNPHSNSSTPPAGATIGGA